MSVPKTFGLAGILGWPVAHSRSPVLHNYWLAEHGLPGSYVLLPAPPERLPAAVAGLAALGFRGCNVTTPHKQAVMPLVDRIDPMAARIGAVNTIVVESDGSLRGFNTDGNGFVQGLRDEKPGWRADEGPVAIFGAGGAARSILAAMIAEGAREIRLVNRTHERAQKLAADLGGPVTVVRWEERADSLAGVATLVNATTQGSAGKPALDLSLDALPREAIVGDAIYVPPETPLLATARARGNRTMNGLGMLLNQARPAFEAWFGVMPSITPGLKRAIESTF
ncbi:MAG: shikimate dehydrogenase [Burkholderiales bacterium]|jgi:shikimate dehydrogenase|nr:shikimate dehydrogenase [Burkholderiales bacterium]